MDQTDNFDPDAFFDDGTVPQIDAGTGLDALNSIQLPSNPNIVKRILDLHFCGSLQDVAWSRQGSVASVSEDGSQVHLQCLQFNFDTSLWELSPAHSISVGSDTIVSLLWSPTGGDLAVADSKGRISLFQAHATAMNRVSETRQGLLDDSDELSQIIGISWLGQDRLDKPKNAVLHSSKTDDRWSTIHGKANPAGPLWSRALVSVDRTGILTLNFQRPDGRYGKSTISLSQTANTLYTHAAFSPTPEGKLLVVLQSYESTLSASFVQMDFSEVRQSPDGSVALSIEMIASKLSSSANGTMMNGDGYDPDAWQLTHLGIVPTTEIEKAVQLPPTIYGIYSNSNRAIGISDPGYLVSSVIRRWTVIPMEQKLHQRFDDLPAKASDTTNILTHTVQRQPDKDEQVIVSAALFENGQSLVVTTQDGRTDFLGTDDLSSFIYRASHNEVTSLASSGFAFPIIPSPICTSLSPNASMQIIRGAEGKTDLVSLEFNSPSDQEILDLSNPAVDAGVAALLLSFSRACWVGGNIDDIFAALQRTWPSNSVTSIITSLYRSLFRDVEFVHERTTGSELEKVIQKPILIKVLSFHWGVSLLNARSRSPFRASLSGQWVWIANNFRFIATFLFVSFREYSGVGAVAPQELIEILCGNIRWSLDVLRYITASILEVGDRQTNPNMFDPPAEGESADGSQGLVALLLNCHWSRIFMIATVKAFRLFAKMPEPRTKQQTQIIRTIHQYSTGKGLNLIALEGGLLDPRWTGNSDTKNDSSTIAARQIEMMATGIVPEIYSGTITRILKGLINAPDGMRDKNSIDRLKLFTDPVDINWVLLRTDHITAEKGPKKVYDVHKKNLMALENHSSSDSADNVIKKCVRCGSHTQDFGGITKEWPRNINMYITRCVCDGPWLVESHDA